MSDEDLIFLIKKGSKAAERTLYQRYSRYARHQAKHYAHEFKGSGISEDEFYAVSFSKTHEALLKYENINKSFFVYWKIVTKNAIYDYVSANSYEAGAKALSGASLDSLCFDNNEMLHLGDIVGEVERNNQIIEFLLPYINGEIEYLTELERRVAELLLIYDYNRKEIAKALGYKESRSNYLVRQTLDKIQKLLKENYL